MPEFDNQWRDCYSCRMTTHTKSRFGFILAGVLVHLFTLAHADIGDVFFNVNSVVKFVEAKGLDWVFTAPCDMPGENKTRTLPFYACWGGNHISMKMVTLFEQFKKQNRLQEVQDGLNLTDPDGYTPLDYLESLKKLHKKRQFFSEEWEKEAVFLERAYKHYGGRYKVYSHMNNAIKSTQ